MTTLFYICFSAVIICVIMFFVYMNAKINSICYDFSEICEKLEAEQKKNFESMLRNVDRCKHLCDDCIQSYNSVMEDNADITDSVSDVRREIGDISDSLEKLFKYIPEEAENEESFEKIRKMYDDGVLNILNYSSMDAIRKGGDNEDKQ